MRGKTGCIQPESPIPLSRRMENETFDPKIRMGSPGTNGTSRDLTEQPDIMLAKNGILNMSVAFV